MYLITSAFGGTLGLIFLAIWALFSIYALVSVLRNPHITGGGKMLWIIVIIIVPVFGSLFYVFWHNIRAI
jgi:hypothetical protein